MEIKRNLNLAAKVLEAFPTVTVSISYGDKEKFEPVAARPNRPQMSPVSISYGDKEKFEHANAFFNPSVI